MEKCPGRRNLASRSHKAKQQAQGKAGVVLQYAADYAWPLAVLDLLT